MYPSFDFLQSHDSSLSLRIDTCPRRARRSCIVTKKSKLTIIIISHLLPALIIYLYRKRRLISTSLQARLDETLEVFAHTYYPYQLLLNRPSLRSGTPTRSNPRTSRRSFRINQSKPPYRTESSSPGPSVNPLL